MYINVVMNIPHWLSLRFVITRTCVEMLPLAGGQKIDKHILMFNKLYILFLNLKVDIVTNKEHQDSVNAKDFLCNRKRNAGNIFFRLLFVYTSHLIRLVIFKSCTREWNTLYTRNSKPRQHKDFPVNMVNINITITLKWIFWPITGMQSWQATKSLQTSSLMMVDILL